MTRIKASILSLLLLPLTLTAGPVLEYPAEIKVRAQTTDEYYRISPVKTDAKAIVYVALDDLPPFPSEELRDTRKMIVLVKANRVGRFRFKAVGTLNDELTVTRFDLVVIGDSPLPPTPVPPTPFPPPDPKPPIPPDPKPTPIPPPDPKPPEPAPTPAPIPGPGFHVLIVYETSAVLPRNQQGILFGKNARDALDKHCGKDGYRIFDKDVDARNDLKIWNDAMQRAKGKQVPWVIVSNGVTGFEGPLPADAGAFIQLLEKYAK